MDAAKRKEFASILNQVASIPRPRLDYRTLSNATLAGCEFIRHLMEIQSYLMLSFRSTGKLPMTKREVRLILEGAMSLTPQDLAEAYAACDDAPLVALIVDLKIEEIFIGAELERRLIDKRIGTVLVLAPFFGDIQPSEKWLTKKLKVDKIKARRPWIQDENDIKQDSLKRAFEEAANLTSPQYAPGPLPPFPLELKPAEASFWNVYLAKAWRKRHQRLRKGVIPVLEEAAEGIPERVRQHRRDEWETIARRAKILHGRERFPSAGPEAWRTDWDLSEKWAAERNATIHGETTGRPFGFDDPSEVVIEKQERREKLKETFKWTTRAYETAAKRSGEKGIRFINELKACKTAQEAASRA